jgi:NADPH:quinone reductase-like Zn-dependent oxidoreductase
MADRGWQVVGEGVGEMNMQSAMKQVVVTAYEMAELVADGAGRAPLLPDEVEGRALVTLVSPGTELNFFYQGKKFPVTPGYAGVFEVTSVGHEVGDVVAGEVMFGMVPHKSHPRVARAGLLAVPKGLGAEAAVFARLIGVSMTTLTTTRARPADRVLVSGMGPVGNLAAQIFTVAGYRVTCVDPIEARCQTARESGLTDVRTHVEEKDAELAGKVALVVECSGHEAAVLSGCRLVKKGGEVVMVGVPWKKQTDLSAHEILHAVFHKYVNLRSGWEWELPREPQAFVQGSIQENMQTALNWLAEGRIKTGALGELASPAECQRVYQDLLLRRSARPVAVFDWR